MSCVVSSKRTKVALLLLYRHVRDEQNCLRPVYRINVDKHTAKELSKRSS